MDEQRARQWAERALVFVASDETLAAALLAASGAAPGELRRMAAREEFAAFILDFLLESDDRVLGFSEAEGIAPETVLRARLALGGTGEAWP